MAAMSHAQENSLAIQHQHSIIRSSESELVLARSAMDPNTFIELEAGSKLGSSPRGFDREDYASIALGETLPDLAHGERYPEFQGQKFNRETEERRLEHLQQQTRLDAARAYFALQHDRAVFKLLSEHSQIVGEISRLEKDRFNHGASTITEASIVETYFATINTKYKIADMRLQNAISRYKRAVGHVPGELDGVISEFDAFLPSSQRELLRTISVEHPLFKTGKPVLEETSGKEAREVAVMRPRSYSDDGVSNRPFWSHRERDLAGPGLRRKKATSAKTPQQHRLVLLEEAKYRATLEQQADRERILENAKAIFNSLKAAQTNIISARHASESSRKAFRSAVEERENRLRTTSEVLEVHELWLEAQLAELFFMLQLNFSKVGLLTLMGKLDEPNDIKFAMPVPVPAPRAIDLNRTPLQRMALKRIALATWLQSGEATASQAMVVQSNAGSTHTGR